MGDSTLSTPLESHEVRGRRSGVSDCGANEGQLYRAHGSLRRTARRSAPSQRKDGAVPLSESPSASPLATWFAVLVNTHFASRYVTRNYQTLAVFSSSRTPEAGTFSLGPCAPAPGHLRSIAGELQTRCARIPKDSTDLVFPECHTLPTLPDHLGIQA
jgi:hypothetical protein